MHKFKVGDRVRFKGNAPCNHTQHPDCYPKDGTVGVVSFDIDPVVDDEVLVHWPKGSTSGDDKWWAFVECLEVVEE